MSCCLLACLLASQNGLARLPLKTCLVLSSCSVVMSRVSCLGLTAVPRATAVRAACCLRCACACACARVCVCARRPTNHRPRRDLVSTQVDEKSAAYANGLRDGEQLLAVDGTPISDMDGYKKLAIGKSPFTVTVLRPAAAQQGQQAATSSQEPVPN